jgi:hypothetical protein
MHEAERMTIPVGSVLPLVDAIGAHEMLAMNVARSFSRSFPR